MVIPAQVQAKMVNIRRSLHMHPELGMEEHRTAALIVRELTSLGLEVQTGIAGTGVVGILAGKEPGKTIALRADMDALPIQDQKSVDYASRVPGKMHACGHDGHVAILLGTAMVLSQCKEKLAGTVKFIFQPAEEGPGGALPMIQCGVLDNPQVDAVLGLHITTLLPTGTIGLNSGPTCASADEIDITIRGKGGHGAYPHLSVDSIVVASHVVTALQSIVSRQVDPLEAAVVSLGVINGGYRRNVIADQVRLEGTVRTLNPEMRKKMEKWLKRLVTGVVESMGATCQIDYRLSYPPGINDPALTRLVGETAQAVLGTERVLTVPPSMGADDFAYFLAAVPGVMFALGAANPAKGCTYPGHHPMFDFDEDAMGMGVAVLTAAVKEYLRFSPPDHEK